YKVDNRKPEGKMGYGHTPDRGEVLAVDLVGPLPRTSRGHTFILTTKDIATKWVTMHPLKNSSAANIVETLLLKVFLLTGIPRVIVADNGSNISGNLMGQVCDRMGIKQSLTSVYHPQANPVERSHRDLKQRLAIQVGNHHADWDR